MLNGSMTPPPQRSETSRVAMIAGLGGAAVLLGVVVMFGVAQLNTQKEQLAQMNEMVAQLAQVRTSEQEVTRTQTPDLLTVEQPAIVATATATAGPVPQRPTTPAAMLQRAVAGGAAPASPAAVDVTSPASAEGMSAEDAELLAEIDAGVQELVQAVVDGNYRVHTEHKDPSFAGRIHYTFVGFEDKQIALGQLLVKAANMSLIQYSDAVVCNLGMVNGERLLFGMVERALATGTPQERLAGLKLEREAREVLAQKAIPPVPVNSTADKIRSLVTNSVTTEEELSREEQRRRDATKFETLAVIQAGVQELVTAVVNGRYDIHTNYEDEHFSGRIHFSFVGQEEDQTELERFLADAAEKGIVAHSNAVVDGDGRVNGHILLFDLVERALENGSLEEQRAGAEMRRRAQEMLAKDVVVGEPANAQGEKFYVVEPGDSLAYIALQFYGNTNDFTRIFEANRASISQPDQIRVGQRLVIPAA